MTDSKLHDAALAACQDMQPSKYERNPAREMQRGQGTARLAGASAGQCGRLSIRYCRPLNVRIAPSSKSSNLTHGDKAVVIRRAEGVGA